MGDLPGGAGEGFIHGGNVGGVPKNEHKALLKYGDG